MIAVIVPTLISKLATALFAAVAFAPVVTVGQTLAPDPHHEERLAWWREARFGMFIHWGLYAVPAGEWKGQPVPGIGEWIMNRARIPVTEYEQLATQFDPVKFNADQWVQIAKDAGVKYITITSKHHDGFAMYGSKVSKYNIVDATPFHRDPLKELSVACQKAGIVLCFYYSQAQDWHEPDGAGNEWDFPPNSQKDFAKYFEAKAIPQVRELLTGYGPIGMMWFDTPILITKEESIELANLVHSLQPKTLVSGRIGHDVGDYDSAGDNQLALGSIARDWETPVTLNDTWGYKKDDNHWKPAEVLLQQLVRTASRSGNYLLNVGPTAEGVIPQPSVDRLRQVGAWLKVNGESIYGTTGSPFPYNTTYGYYTQRPGKLYLHLMAWPDKPFTVYGIKNRISRAYLLADASRKALVLKQTSDPKLDLYSTTIQLPAAAPDKYDGVVALEIGGKADVVTSITQQPDRSLFLEPYVGQLQKGSSDSAMAIDRNGVVTRWVNSADSVSWGAKLFHPGTYEVVLTTAMVRMRRPPMQPGAPRPAGIRPGPPPPVWDGGHKVTLEVGAARVSGTVAEDSRTIDPSNPLETYVTSRIGRVQIAQAGPAHIVLRADSLNTEHNAGLTLASVKLIPVK